MKKKYSSRYNFLIHQDDVQSIGEELEKHFPTGKIDPEGVVEIAAAVDSPLHDYFEWNDKVAADAHRLQQARNLIRAIVVEIDGHMAPAYHSVFVAEDDSLKYVDVFNARSDGTLWNQVLTNALREIESWTKRYKDYQELAPIVAAVNQVKGKLNEKDSSEART